MATVLGGFLVDAHPHSGTRAKCVYMAEKVPGTPREKFMVGIGQREQTTEDEEPFPIRIRGRAMNFEAERGDTVTVNSFKEADCAGDATAHTQREVRVSRGKK